MVKTFDATFGVKEKLVRVGLSTYCKGAKALLRLIPVADKQRKYRGNRG
ncbi:hypothetical protein SAMN05660206_10139 [Sphingobacterium wenxiniae]|uniref:Uncharacterized protein n=1 Tax=Sphingobacterium wenxiniae TaxID=683125 RepID=A0A1I6NRP9_9SPHI|nr:hypothetical protein SAMN05660206_10139 [Sphingobacterium wenxiniae]